MPEEKSFEEEVGDILVSGRSNPSMLASIGMAFRDRGLVQGAQERKVRNDELAKAARDKARTTRTAPKGLRTTTGIVGEKTARELEREAAAAESEAKVEGDDADESLADA